MILKKRGHKQNLVKLNSFKNRKIVFVLPTVVIVFYKRLIIINIKRLNLKRLFSSFFSSCLNLKNCSNDLLKIFFNKSSSIIYESF